MGIGYSNGFPEWWTAGAIVSGAYFGDKMSALSDTTVLAASTAKVPLFSHIRYMMYTTVPTFVIALLIYTVAGLCIYDSNSVISNELVDALHGVFNISPWLLVVPAFTFTLIAKKVPALLTLFLSMLAACVAMLIFQPEIVAGIGGSEVLLCDPDDAGGRAELLHAAVFAAVAGLCLVAVENQMSDLTACTVHTVDHLAAHHDTTADTGAKGGKDHVVAALTATLPAFTQGGHGGIVTGLHGQTCKLGQLLLNIKYTPAQIDALIYCAVLQYRAGNTDTDADDSALFCAGLRHVTQHRCGNVRQDLLATVCGDRGDLPLVQQVAGFVKIGDLDGRAAQIYAVTISHMLASIGISYIIYYLFKKIHSAMVFWPGFSLSLCDTLLN
jgi:hypothetical protein